MSLDTILKAFTKIIAKLEKLQKQNAVRAEAKKVEITSLEVKAGKKAQEIVFLNDEAARAAVIKQKLENLISA